MKILAIDVHCAALDWYMRCLEDGHKVKVFIKQTEKSKNLGRGLIDIVEDWRDHVDWADMIFVGDNTKYLEQLDVVRKAGKLVCGATKASSEWELDREIGQEIMSKCGIDTIQSQTFTDYDKAIAYVKKENKRFVSKPSGDADKALSYVSKNPEDMIFMLERWKKNAQKKMPFILQEFIPGIEMAVGGFFGPGGFNEGWLENFEFKKLMNDDLGCNTGEQGTVVRFVKDSKLAEEMLLPIEDELQKTGHTGYVDVSVIIDENGKPWPLEFTMRPGYPTLNILQALYEGDHADWVFDLLEGLDGSDITYDTICTGVVLSIPDYPYSHLTRKEVVGIPIYGMEQPLDKHLHPCEVMAGSAPHNVDGKIVDKKCLVTAGDYVMVVTGLGDTVKESSKAAYKRINNIVIPNSPGYRTDIGNRLKKQLPILQKFGYAEGMKYE